MESDVRTSSIKSLLKKYNRIYSRESSSKKDIPSKVPIPCPGCEFPDEKSECCILHSDSHLNKYQREKLECSLQHSHCCPGGTSLKESELVDPPGDKVEREGEKLELVEVGTSGNRGRTKKQESELPVECVRGKIIEIVHLSEYSAMAKIKKDNHELLLRFSMKEYKGNPRIRETGLSGQLYLITLGVLMVGDDVEVSGEIRYIDGDLFMQVYNLDLSEDLDRLITTMNWREDPFSIRLDLKLKDLILRNIRNVLNDYVEVDSSYLQSISSSLSESITKGRSMRNCDIVKLQREWVLSNFKKSFTIHDGIVYIRRDDSIVKPGFLLKNRLNMSPAESIVTSIGLTIQRIRNGVNWDKEEKLKTSIDYSTVFKVISVNGRLAQNARVEKRSRKERKDKDEDDDSEEKEEDNEDDSGEESSEEEDFPSEYVVRKIREKITSEYKDPVFLTDFPGEYSDYYELWIQNSKICQGNTTDSELNLDLFCKLLLQYYIPLEY